MPSVKKLIAFVGAALIASAGFAEYQPAKWNREARKAFAAQRFGVFIHWGLYANYAQGEWYLRNAGLDEAAYSRMMYGFCPSKFDAREWVSIVKASGAKYITITTRHHDGFSLWPTKVDDGYNIANSPFKRDIIGELAEACKAEGIQLNFYYSLMDWHRGDYPPGGTARAVKLERKPDYTSYKAFMMAQIAELIDAYQPGNIWFDGEWEHPASFDWEFDDIYDLIHSKRVLVANNNHKALRPKEDIQLFERDLPGENATGFSKDQVVEKDAPLEQCDVIQKGVWGYRIAESNFRSAEEVVAMVVRAAAKGSNLLMNIGPDGSGQFPARAVEVMEATGEWFKTNGESVYATQAGGVSSGKDVVSTRTSEALYLHFLNPKVNSISFVSETPFKTAETLEKGVKAKLAVNGREITVTVDRPAGSSWDIVVKLPF